MESATGTQVAHDAQAGTSPPLKQDRGRSRPSLSAHAQDQRLTRGVTGAEIREFSPTNSWLASGNDPGGKRHALRHVEATPGPPVTPPGKDHQGRAFAGDLPADDALVLRAR